MHPAKKTKTNARIPSQLAARSSCYGGGRGGGGGGGLAGLGYDYRECEDIPVAIQSLACNSVLPFRLGCRLSWDAIVGLV